MSQDEIVYRFSELSECAKDRVRARFMDGGWDRGDEYLESLKALAKHFDGSLHDWSICWDGSSYSKVDFSMPGIGEFSDTSEAEDEDGDVDENKLLDLHRQEIQRRLDDLGSYDPETLRGHGDCKLTGACYDESAIDGFRQAFLSGESDVDALMHAAFNELRAAAEKDWEYDYSDEGISENCDLWFNEEGGFEDAPKPGKGRYSKEEADRRARVRRLSAPHGSCFEGVCAEHVADKSVPACALGKRPPRRGKGRGV